MHRRLFSTGRNFTVSQLYKSRFPEDKLLKLAITCPKQKDCMAIPTWRPKLMKSIMNLFRRCGHGMTRKGLTRGKDKIRFNLINIINNSDPSWKALQSPRGRVSDMVRLGSTNQIVPSVNNINGLGLGIDQTVQRGFSRLAGTSMQKVQTQLRTCRQLLQRAYI